MSATSTAITAEEANAQSLPSGMIGRTLLAVEQALRGGPWPDAHRLLRRATAGAVDASSRASLYYGAPAIAFVLHAASADGVGRYSSAARMLTDHARRIAAQIPAEVLYDWAGGLVWLELEPSDDAGATLVREAVAAAGGHATLVRAPAASRATVAVFDPLDQMTATLTRRIKEQFDPKRVLNPGRMYAGV